VTSCSTDVSEELIYSEDRCSSKDENERRGDMHKKEDGE
jgi:hypothetical protein